jgi:hypothetical protein
MADPDEIDATMIPALRPHVAAELLDGEAVLYDEWTGKVVVLYPSGSMAMQLIDGETTIGDIGEAIAEATAAAPHAVTEDIIAFTRMLAEVGVLEGYEPVPASQSPP